ncbi:hypothetical protein LCGC14_1976740, partial [marine sediment metagenome]
MATQINISTISALKAIKNLRDITKEMTRAMGGLSTKIVKFETNLQGASRGASALARSSARQLEAQRKLTRNTNTLNRRLVKQMQTLKGVTVATKTQTAASRKLSVSTKRVAKDTKGFGAQIRNLGSAAVFAVGPLSGIGARVVAFGAVAERSGKSVAFIAIALTGLTIALAAGIRTAIKAGIEYKRFQNTMEAATGSVEKAAQELDFLARQSQALGLDLKVVAGQFAQLSASAKQTSLEGLGVRQIFTAVSKASLVLGLSADQTQGAFRALVQIMSKGTVQSEELRGQLGERIPGAFRIAARAMGVTTRELGKMLEQGEVLSDEFLPKFALELEKAFGPQAAAAIGQVGAATNVMSTEFFLLAKDMDTTFKFSEKLASSLRFVADILKRLRGEVVLTQEEMLDLSVNVDRLNKALALRGALQAKAAAGGVGGILANPAITADRLKTVNALIAELTKFLRDLLGLGPVNIGVDRAGAEQVDAFSKKIKELDKSISNLRGQMSILGDTSKNTFQKLDAVDKARQKFEALNAAI